MNLDYKWPGMSEHFHWEELHRVYFPMFSFASSIYDEDEMYFEFLRNFEAARLKGLPCVRSDFPNEAPDSISDFVALFKKFCLPYQKFERSPLLTYSFVPDVAALVESIREDEIYTVPDLAALPENAIGMVLVVSKEFTELWYCDNIGKDLIWRASRDWGVRIMEEASEDE